MRQVRRSILGQLVTAAPCPRCQGLGQIVANPCTQCHGDGRMRVRQTIDVEVPAGIDDGQRLRIPGRGPAAPRGGPAGDLYVLVRVRPDPTSRTPWRGPRLPPHDRDDPGCARCLVRVREARRSQLITVDPGTQSGSVVRRRGHGIPVLNGRGRGDLLVEITVEVPNRLDQEQAELLAQFAELRGETIDPPEGGFFSKLRAAFDR